MARRELSHRNEGSATLDPTRTRIPQQGIAAAAVGAVAFLCYYRTLLPGLDLGDSASFQTIAGSLTLNPRQAYPLYFGLANIFVWLHPGEPPRAMNFASAFYGALAAGLASWLAARLSHSLPGGIGAGLFLTFSYTFWSQAVTAEVYTLHLMVVGAGALAAMAWADRPTVERLAVFYALYALGFGNHLSMVLSLPAFTVFLLFHRRPGSADPLRSRMLLMAAGIAALGALQYAWNFRGLWADLEPPATFVEAVAKFWFDVTKEDWRATLVNTVSETGLQHRPSMYWFDLQQQVGVPGVALAAVGFCYIQWRWPKRGLFLLLFYASNMAFAWTYNVGDAYIFFLPSHYIVALCAGGGIAAIGAVVSRMSNRTMGAAASALLLLYPAWRGYDTFPAVDRSGDRRAEQLLNAFANDTSAVYGVDTNWQVQNAFEYFMRERRPGMPWFYTEEFEWLQGVHRFARFNQFVARNAEMGRRVIVSGLTAQKVMDPPPPGWMDDVEPHSESFGRRLESVRTGTPYALAVLLPDQEYSLDSVRLNHVWQQLAPGVMMPTLRQYTVIIGRAGGRPVLVESRDRPYRVEVVLEPFDFDVRMESWLPTDTIRRAGFGHVIVNRRHVLTLERGISFVALGPEGGLSYDSGLFAPIRRYVVKPDSER